MSTPALEWPGVDYRTDLVGSLVSGGVRRGGWIGTGLPPGGTRGSGLGLAGLAAGAERVDFGCELVADFFVHHADVSHDFAALGIEEDECWECVDVEFVGDGLAFFDEGVGVVVLFEVCAGIIDAVVCVDADDEDVVVCGELFLEDLDVRRACSAGAAPGCPKVGEDGFALPLVLDRGWEDDGVGFGGGVGCCVAGAACEGDEGGDEGECWDADAADVLLCHGVQYAVCGRIMPAGVRIVDWGL